MKWVFCPYKKNQGLSWSAEHGNRGGTVALVEVVQLRPAQKWTNGS
jgi:hypothetical protein